MSKKRLDQELVARGLLPTRSQAESYIKLGYVNVDGQTAAKSGQLVDEQSKIKLIVKDQYVSRAAFKLDSVAKSLGLSFNNKVVLDVGSSTGGFTDYALQHGANKVIAVEVGTNQLHPSLRSDDRIELHEKTDIRDFQLSSIIYNPDSKIDMILIDVSFISLREILPSISKLTGKNSQIVAMVKPQFEASKSDMKHKGVIKNDRMRREILKDFETWVQKVFIIADKADSAVSGAKGNSERFYLLRYLPNRK